MTTLTGQAEDGSRRRTQRRKTREEGKRRLRGDADEKREENKFGYQARARWANGKGRTAFVCFDVDTSAISGAGTGQPEAFI